MAFRRHGWEVERARRVVKLVDEEEVAMRDLKRHSMMIRASSSRC